MNKEILLNILGQWGSSINRIDQQSEEKLYIRARARNGWFTQDSIDLAIKGLQNYLSIENLEKWLRDIDYSFDSKSARNVGIVMAGNIPMVGFHDLLCVIVSGHRARIKLSSQDSVLIPYILDILIGLEPRFRNTITIVERLDKSDAVIATGSNNTARYFKYYFRDVPYIIRKNRTSVGIINGDESTEALHALGTDMLTYYGLGCRNISKIFIPEDYEFDHFFEAIQSFDHIFDTQKYVNNYDYNKSIYLVNREDFRDNGFFMLRASDQLVSPVSVVFYEKYEKIETIRQKIELDQEKIQCVTSDKAWFENSIAFGMAQKPQLWDYADNINTLEFLSEI